MRVQVDGDRCEGHGLCVYAAPDVFHLDDDGQLHHDPHPSEDQRAAVQDAIGSCPTAAITLDAAVDATANEEIP